MDEEEFKNEVKGRLENFIGIVKCKKCEAEIFFMQTRNRKWIPLDFDLVPHFKSCPFASDFRKDKHGNNNKE